VHLPVGQHAYKFLLDGKRWLDDPNNPLKAHDGVGGLNSTLAVPESGRPVVIHTVDVATSVFGVKLQSQRNTT